LNKKLKKFKFMTLLIYFYNRHFLIGHTYFMHRSTDVDKNWQVGFSWCVYKYNREGFRKIAKKLQGRKIITFGNFDLQNQIHIRL
jgi:hypothetical protein